MTSLFFSRVRELTQSAAWFVRELTSPRNDLSATWPVRDLTCPLVGYPRVGLSANWPVTASSGVQDAPWSWKLFSLHTIKGQANLLIIW